MSSWVIILIVSLVLSGFFSGMEIAFVSANKVRANIDMQHKGLTNSVLNVFYKHREMFISTLLIGNNIVNVIYSIALANLLTAPLKGLLGENEAVVLTMLTLISTLLILIAGEFLPKAIFRINPNYSLRTFALPLMMVYWVLYPISRFTEMLSAGLMRLLGIKLKDDRVGVLTVDELGDFVQQAIDKQEDQNKVVDPDVKMFGNALDFGDTRLHDCMVPRNEIVAVDIADTPRDKLVETFTRTGLSKVVVYRDDIDNVIGFLQVSELFVPDVDWKTRVKPVLFAPETMLASKMMHRLMDQRRSMAIVIDEFGGTSGMVTLEDLVEEIFGEIEDEHDRNRLVAKQIDDDAYEFSGRMEVEEINERFHLDLPESDDYQTLAGYIINHYEEIPSEGQTLRIDSYDFTIVRKTAARIVLVSVKRVVDDEAAETATEGSGD